MAQRFTTVIPEECFQAPASRAAAIKILDFARERGYDYSALTGEVSYFSRNSQRIKRFERYNEIARARGVQEMRLEYSEGRDYVNIENEILKLLLYLIPEEELAALTAFLDSLPEIVYTSSDEGLLDVMAAGINKGTAIAEVRKLLGLERSAFWNYITISPCSKRLSDCRNGKRPRRLEEQCIVRDRHE